MADSANLRRDMQSEVDRLIAECKAGGFDRVTDHSSGRPVIEVDGEVVAACDYHGPPIEFRLPLTSVCRPLTIANPSPPGPASVGCSHE